MSAWQTSVAATCRPVWRTRPLWAILLVGVVGCRQEKTGLETQPAPPAGEPIPLILKTPEDAARTVLTCLRAIRAASLRGDRAAVAWYREQLRPMAARDVILKRYQAIRHTSREDPEVIFDRFLQGWSAILAYYLDGMQLDRLTVASAAGATQADVHVPAVSDRGEVLIRLECSRDPDRLWRVARIDFARPTTAATSSSTTASRGAGP
jgi:hypothetical protein